MTPGRLIYSLRCEIEGLNVILEQATPSMEQTEDRLAVFSLNLYQSWNMVR